jgi:hypothetical protein
MNYNVQKCIVEHNGHNEGFLNQVVSVNDLQLIEYINKNCKQYIENINDKILFKGLDSTEPFYYVNANKLNQYSENVQYYYTYFVNNSEKWNKFPKRGFSLKCTQNENHARIFGNLYYVIPFDNIIFGVCPKLEFIRSFEYLYSRNFDAINFNDLLKNFYFDIFKESIKDDTIENFKISLSKFDDINTVKNKIKRIDSFFMKELYSNYSLYKKESFFEFIIETIFNPNRGFKVIQWNENTKLPSKNELWTKSECLLIREDLYKNVFN